MGNYLKKIVYGAGIAFIMTIVSAAIGFFTKLYLARAFDVDQVGIFYAVLSLIGAVQLFKNFGISGAIKKFIPEYLIHKDYEKISFMILFATIFSIITTTILAIIMIALSGPLSISFFNNPSTQIIIIILSIQLLFSKSFGLISSINLAVNKVFQSKLIGSLADLLTLFLIPFLAYLGIKGVAIAYTIGAIIALIFGLTTFPLKKKLIWPKWNKKEAKKYVKFSMPLALSEVLVKPAKYFDVLFITLFRSLAEVGIFSVVYTLPLILTRFAAAFGTVLLPRTSELHAKSLHHELNLGLQELYKYMLFIITPLAAIFLIFPSELILFLYGQEYVRGAIVVQALAIGAIFHNISIINSSVLNGAGHTGLVATLTAISTASSIILNLILIPTFGITGAGIAGAIQYLIVFACSAAFIKKKLKTKLPTKSITIIVLAGVLFTLIALLIVNTLPYTKYITIPIALGVSTIAYLATTILTKVINPKKIVNILSKLKPEILKKKK